MIQEKGADIAVEDNTALAQASQKAQELGLPLVWLFVLSPGDYKMHDRSPKRIDFMLRNLRYLRVRPLPLLLVPEPLLSLKLTLSLDSTSSTFPCTSFLSINAYPFPVGWLPRSSHLWEPTTYSVTLNTKSTSFGGISPLSSWGGRTEWMSSRYMTGWSSRLVESSVRLGNR